MKGIIMQPYHIPLIVAGKKVETRRLESSLKEINKEPDKWELDGHVWIDGISPKIEAWVFIKAGFKVMEQSRYRAGEVCYIKEAWCEDSTGEVIHYKADGGESPGPKVYFGKDKKWHDYKQPFWRSPLFLPERFARHFIQMGEPRPERLQDITEEGAIAEGIIKGDNAYYGCLSETPLRFAYARLWDTINKPLNQWASNPWCFVYLFKYLGGKP